MAQEPEDDNFEGGDGEPDFEGGGGGGKKKLLLLAIPLVLIIAGAAAWFTGAAKPLVEMITGKHDETEEAAHEGAEDAHGKPAAAADHGGGGGAAEALIHVQLPEMLVSVNAGRKRQFLKVKTTVELGSDADVARLESVQPRIVESFQIYLREMRPEDLEGSAGMYRIKEELVTRVNAAMRPAQVRDVLITEFTMQ